MCVYYLYGPSIIKLFSFRMVCMSLAGKIKIVFKLQKVSMTKTKLLSVSTLKCLLLSSNVRKKFPSGKKETSSSLILCLQSKEKIISTNVNYIKLLCSKFKWYLHWQSFLAKTSAMMLRIYSTLLAFAYMGDATQIGVPVCVVLLKEGKASKVE